jgi:hypothetical protein
MRYFITLSLLVVLTSCGFHKHNNFNKQKFTNLKGLEHNCSEQNEANNEASAKLIYEQENQTPNENKTVAVTPSLEETVVTIATEIENEKTTIRQEINSKIKTIKGKFAHKSAAVKKIQIGKKLKQKLRGADGVGIGLIGLSILFLVLALVAALLMVISIEVGFTGIFWGVVTAIFGALFILFLVLGVIKV